MASKTLKAILSPVIIASTMTALPSAASADILKQRCNHDSLTPAEAEVRLEWARKCALQNDLVGGASAFVNVAQLGFDEAAPSTLIFQFIDYNATNVGTNSFLTDGVAGGINGIFRNNLYDTAAGINFQFTDAAGWKKWRVRSGSNISDPEKKLPRPLYPTYGSTTNINTSAALYPPANLTASSPCVLYTTPIAAEQTWLKLSSSYYVNGFCESSCYTPDQEVLFPGGYERIGDAVKALRPEIVTLSKDASLEKIAYTTNKVGSYTAELFDSTHVIFEIKTASGGMLRVTDEHPLVDGSGKIVQAKALQKGDNLVKEDGQLDPVVSVERTTHFGKVYNVKPKTTDPVTHVLVAQGYLVGSSHFQNDYINYVNQIVLHRSIPDEVLP
ncbi:Hint domain-containing protein [Polyangium sorediatum]|uniref:Hint domain-containing protein n=1 Tax=Polyangium sorediatum TaxID=889274 RepID=A0ABT6NNG1_9BACT|nr:Hint domain-containing protein [Polyangium sorediatum]MDI1429863.1 Hint domain-containing protein [Polyangium sorediatum]